MKFIMSKSFLLVVGVLLSLLKFLSVFHIDIGSLMTASQRKILVYVAGDVISLAMFLGMIGVIVYALSKGVLDESKN